MKAVFFDLYGTLLDIRTDEEDGATWERFAAWMTAHGMAADAAELKKEFFFGTEVLKMQPSLFAYPEPELLPVFAAMCVSRGGKAETAAQAAQAFRRASTRLLQPYPETIPTLRYLREKGIRVILLSNAQHSFTMPELETTGLKQYLDRIFISSDAGCRKPDAAFFRMAMESEGLKPEECIMVGNDGSSDIAGAKAAGMDAVYLRTAISPAEELPECRWVFEDGDIGHVREIL